MSEGAGVLVAEFQPGWPEAIARFGELVEMAGGTTGESFVAMQMKRVGDVEATPAHVEVPVGRMWRVGGHHGQRSGRPHAVVPILPMDDCLAVLPHDENHVRRQDRSAQTSLRTDVTDPAARDGRRRG